MGVDQRLYCRKERRTALPKAGREDGKEKWEAAGMIRMNQIKIRAGKEKEKYNPEYRNCHADGGPVFPALYDSAGQSDAVVDRTRAVRGFLGKCHDPGYGAHPGSASGSAEIY